MLRLTKFYFNIISANLIFLSFVAMLSSSSLGTYFKIDKDSHLSISGTSNVNKFVCDCTQEFPKTFLEMRMSEDNNHAKFHNALLKITTTKLDCKHRVMNRDMYKTLKADEHPHILIALKEVSQLPNQPISTINDWVSLKAKVVITIAGANLEKTLNIQAKKIDGNRYRFKGEKELLMTDFGIEPPTAMLGLIKVDDTITINLDLVVSIIE